jgi:hypothetical protein
MPEPHSKQAPSSQLERGALSGASSGSGLSGALGFSAAALLLALCADSGAGVLSPPQANSMSKQSSDAGRARQAGDRGGGDERVTTRYLYAKYWRVNIQRCPSR